MFEKEWDQKVHSYNRPDMILGRNHHKRPSNHLALASRPYHIQDYDQETTTAPHKERKRERHSRHREHFGSEDNKYDQHVTTDLDSDLHQHGKPKGLRASKLDAGHHHSRPKAPGVGHRSKLSKNVNFPDDIDVPVRKQPHHYSKYAQESSRHSTKKSTNSQFDC